MARPPSTMPFLAQEHVDIPTKDLLSWTFDDLKYDPDKPIYIDAADPSNSISARQARTIIRKLVAGLRSIGLKPGDCVCLHSINDLYYPIVFLAIVAAGGIFAGTNVAYTPYELVHFAKTAKVKYVIAAPEHLKSMLNAAQQVGLDKSKIIMFNPDDREVPTGYTTFKDLLQRGEQDWVRFDDLKTAENTLAALLFSSGTTGLPKAVKLSHHNFIAQHTLVNEIVPKPYEPKRLLALPMFHAASTPAACCTPLRAGQAAYIMRTFDLEMWFTCMEKYAITEVAMVPPIVILIIMSPLRHKYSLKAAKQAQCGAAPLDRRPQARLQELMAEGAPFTQVWGMTETSCVATMFRYPETDVTGSVGRPLPNLDVKLVDEDGREVTDYDVKGELCVRGPIVTKGYFENPEANARDFDSEGFFHTGDVAYCDGKSKLFYIVDRRKELIKVRGFQVAPPELEGVLLSHPDIVDCAVIGVKYSRDESELPRAYVVLRSGSENRLSTEDVKRYMAERLSYYKRLDGGVLFVDAIPKTASGKILKRVLRERAEKELGVKL